MPHAPREDKEPWYKQFWPWFLISLPATAVIGSMITIKLAVDTADGLVVDDYYKEGLGINRDLSKVKFAKSMEIAANIDVDNDTGQLEVLLLGKLKNPPKLLNMKLFHPTQEGQDQELQLLAAGNDIYVTRLPKMNPAKWKVTILPENEEWKISGRLKLPQVSVARIE